MDYLAAWAPYAMLGLIIGIVGLIGFYLYKGKERTRIIGGVLCAVILLVSVFSWIGPTGDGGGGGDQCPTGQTWNPATQECEIIASAPWTWSVPATRQGGGRDAATEIFNDAGTAFSLDCVADTPDGTLDVFETNVFFNIDTDTFTIKITMDDDAAQSAAAFSAPDCHSNDFFGKPEHPVDINNDGSADNQLAWAQLVSVSRSVLTDNSTSNIPVQSFFYTMTEGYYFSFMQEDADQTGAGNWVSACEGSVGKQVFDIADCKPTYIGDTTSTAFYSAFAFLLDSNTPLWGYQNGQLQDYETIVIRYGHGGSPGIVWDQTYTYNIVLDIRT